MCNRITLTIPDAAMLQSMLGLDVQPEVGAVHIPRFNICPTQEHWIITPQLPLRLMRAPWGLGPQRQLNQRVETLARRGLVSGTVPCAIPADGFLEWEGPKQDRRPVYFQQQDHGLFLLAGVFDGHGFTVLTTPPDDVVAPVHDRMPVIMAPQGWRRWLSAPQGKGALGLLDVPPPGAPSVLTARRVSKRINSTTFDDPACLGPAEPPEQPRQLKLF